MHEPQEHMERMDWAYKTVTRDEGDTPGIKLTINMREKLGHREHKTHTDKSMTLTIN